MVNVQLLCGDISESGGLGVCWSEDGSLWVWDPDDGETRIGDYMYIHMCIIMYKLMLLFYFTTFTLAVMSVCSIPSRGMLQTSTHASSFHLAL